MTQVRPDTSVRPLRKNRNLLPALVLFFLPFLFPGVMIFSTGELLGGDRPTYHLPHQQFIFDHFREGVIPFWNPYVFAGTPEFGNPEWASMYPPHFIPLMLLGPVGMMKFKYLFHLGLAGLGAFVLFRTLSIHIALAFVGGLTLQHSGFHITKIALPNQGDSATWLPLMLALGIWFSRCPSLRRGLSFGLLGGMMLMLFFPQITIPLWLLVFCVSVIRFIKVRGSASTAGASFIDKKVLPVLEVGILLALMRYPRRPMEVVTGLEHEGAILIAFAGLFYIAWLTVLRTRIRVDWRRLGRWFVPFIALWVLASAFAAPQLTTTWELIKHCSLETQHFAFDRYFTGRQSYGFIHNFATLSALGVDKSAANNMALGPIVYLLIVAGIAGGFHRRHRYFFFFLLVSLPVTVLYFDVQPIGYLARRMPFFSRFLGFSRYLAFLNLAFVALAILSAQLWTRKAPVTKRRFVLRAFLLLFMINFGFLLHHEAGHWGKVLSSSTPYTLPKEVCEMVDETLDSQERTIIDPRGHDWYFPILMYGAQSQRPILPGYGPMRLSAYDVWLCKHNQWHVTRTVDYLSDYRARLLVPRPSPWSRALRVRGYLFPIHGPTTPGFDRVSLSEEDIDYMGPGVTTLDDMHTSPLLTSMVAGAWQLHLDPVKTLVVWPEEDLAADPPSMEGPSGWKAKLLLGEINRLEYEVFNSGAETWAIISHPAYPGWKAWVNDQEAEIEIAYGFLRAVRIGPGESVIRMEYRPQSFAFGWVIFLWAVWIWIMLYFWYRTKKICRLTCRWIYVFVVFAVLGIVTVIPISFGVWGSAVESLWLRGAELFVVASLALAAGFALFRFCLRGSGE